MGSDKFNVLSNTVAVMNLGQIPSYGYSGESRKWVSKFYQKIIKLRFVELFKCFCCQACVKARYLSYYYVMVRIVEGLVIVAITTVIYYVTGVDGSGLFVYLIEPVLYTLFLGYICQIMLYQVMLQTMNMGVSLLRDTTTYVINYQFCDAIRSETLLINGSKRSNNLLDTQIKVIETILTIIIENNVSLLIVDRCDFIAISNYSKKYKNDDITSAQAKEHLYLWQTINNVTDNKIQILLKNILANAIFHGHSSMIYFIMGNDWIDNIIELRFGQSLDKSLLQYSIDNCSHRVDIIEALVTKYGPKIKNFNKLLKHKTGMHYVIPPWLRRHVHILSLL